MKFNETTTQVKIKGDIQKNKVSIDTENIDFIVTILSTNLYSNPVQSFVRETVSNAWDAHNEAGIDEPVILELGRDSEDKDYCRIQDFGVGLSPQRFNEVYRMIGSSTKRGTNDQIGGFGIGRFSALSVSDMVHITTCHKGIKYKYLMYKDGNSLSIDLLHEDSTDERNGLEVLIYIDADKRNYFQDAIRDQLIHFENLYVIDNDDSGFTAEFNNFRVKRYKNFFVNSLDRNSKGMRIMLGKVTYPLRFSNLNTSFPDSAKKFPIALQFEIGELEVTPNREEILYSDKSIKAIEDKITAALSEILELKEQQKVKDCNSIKEYLTALRETPRLSLLEDGGNNPVVTIPMGSINILLKGVRYNGPNLLAIYEWIMNNNYFDISHKLRNRKISVSKYRRNTNLETLRSYVSNDPIKTGGNYLSNDPIKNYLIVNMGSLKGLAKEYLRDTYGNMDFVRWPNPMEAYKEYRKGCENTVGHKFSWREFKVIAKYILKNIRKLPTFTNNDIPQEWLEERKIRMAEKRKGRVHSGINWKSEISLHELRPSQRGDDLTTDIVIHKLDKLKTVYKRLVIYSKKDDPEFRKLYPVLFHHAKLIEVAPTKIKPLQFVPNFVKFEDFMKNIEYKLLRNIGTAEYIKQEIPHILQVADIRGLDRISGAIHSMAKELRAFHDKYSAYRISQSSYIDDHKTELREEIYEFCKEKKYFNEEIRGLIDNNRTTLDNSKVLLLFSGKSTSYDSHLTIPEERINVIVDYVLARGLFRPDPHAILKLKEETIYNIKQEEDEDNQT